MVPASGPGSAFTFTDEEVGLLARLEHERWVAGQMTLFPADGPEPADRAYHRLVPWEQLPDRVQARYAEAARGVPATLANVGFQVLRDGRADDGG